MTRADALARLAVCAAEARAMLLAGGVDDVDDRSVAEALAADDAELTAAGVTHDYDTITALRRGREAVVAAHRYLVAVQRAQRKHNGETTT